MSGLRRKYFMDHGNADRDRWVHRVRNNGRRGHPNGGVGSEQVDGTAVA